MTFEQKNVPKVFEDSRGVEYTQASCLKAVESILKDLENEERLIIPKVKQAMPFIQKALMDLDEGANPAPHDDERDKVLIAKVKQDIYSTCGELSGTIFEFTDERSRDAFREGLQEVKDDFDFCIKEAPKLKRRASKLKASLQKNKFVRSHVYKLEMLQDDVHNFHGTGAAEGSKKGLAEKGFRAGVAIRSASGAAIRLLLRQKG